MLTEETTFCDVCGEFDTCVQAVMPGTSIAVAYCQDCSLVGAQPFELLALQVAKIGGIAALATAEAVDIVPVIYDTLQRLGRSMEDFEAAVNNCVSFIEMNGLHQPEEESNVGNDDSISATGSGNSSDSIAGD